MANYDLRKNAEGYADPTAYNGIKGAETPVPGEIYMLMNTKKGKEEHILCIQQRGEVVNFLRLQQYSGTAGCIKLLNFETNPGMLSWCFTTSSDFRYVRAVPHSDFEMVLDAIEDYFDIRIETELVEPEVKVAEPAAPAEPVRTEQDEAGKAKLEALTQDVIKFKTLAETYEKLYNGILERMIKNG